MNKAWIEGAPSLPINEWIVCEQHPHLLWSGAHRTDQGMTCPHGCSGPGMSLSSALTLLGKLRKELTSVADVPEEAVRVDLGGFYELGEFLDALADGAEDERDAMLRVLTALARDPEALDIFEAHLTNEGRAALLEALDVVPRTDELELSDVEVQRNRERARAEQAEAREASCFEDGKTLRKRFAEENARVVQAEAQCAALTDAIRAAMDNLVIASCHSLVRGSGPTADAYYRLGDALTQSPAPEPEPVCGGPAPPQTFHRGWNPDCPECGPISTAPEEASGKLSDAEYEAWMAEIRRLRENP